MLLIVIIAVIILAFISSRIRMIKHAKKHNENKRAEKESYKKGLFMTYGQVQQKKEELLETIETHLADKPNEKELLKHIIQDWAALKIKAFKNRRSWVRSPNMMNKNE